MAERTLKKYFIIKQIPVTGIILSLCLMPLGLALTAPVTAAAVPEHTVIVTDVLNRNVKIALPIERCVTINTSVAVILRALGVDVESKIVGVTSYIRENPKFWPMLKDKPTLEYKSLNYEKLAELNPQVVFLYGNSPRFTDEKKLKTLKIKCLYLDCFNPDRLPEEIKLLGALFDRQKKAEELINWMQHYDRLIQSRLVDVAVSKCPRVFYYQYPDVNLPKGIYRTVNRNSSTHPLIARAGGNNLATGLPGENAVVSAEWIVENNPDILLAGVLGKTFSGYNAGNAESENNMQNIRRQLAHDRAFRHSDAVRDNRILILSHDIQQGPSYIIGMAYITKFIHPDQFTDLHPDVILKEYHEKWCGLPHGGVYVYPPFDDISKGIYPYPEKPVDSNQPEQDPAKPVTITDSAGRQVVVPQPLERIAGLQTSACNAFSLLQLDDKVVGVTEYIWNDPTGYPRLSKKPNIGSVYTPNYEIIAQIRPQLVFMSTSQVNLDPAVQKLAPMGMAVAAFDFQPIKGDDAYAREAHYDQELLMLGRLTGREKRAREFIRWKTDILDLIRRRTRDIEKKRVMGVNSVARILKQNSFMVWAGKRIIELAGGLDDTSGLNGQEINGEWIVEQNPEVIILASYWLEEGLGYGVTDTVKVRETYQKVVKNSVIAQTRACETGHVYLFGYYGLASGGQTALGALYLAKRLYPERFSDIDPETYHREYLEKWLNINYQGVWFYP